MKKLKLYRHKYRLPVLQAGDQIVLFYQKYNSYHYYRVRLGKFDQDLKDHVLKFIGMIINIHQTTIEHLLKCQISYCDLHNVYDNQYIEPYRCIRYVKRIFKSNKAENDDVIHVATNNDLLWDDMYLIGGVSVECEFSGDKSHTVKPKINYSDQTIVFV